MYQKERIDKITELLKVNGYVTVKFLTEQLHYSTATVNRDLNIMEKQKLVHRTYGGVELIKRREVPLLPRYHKMRTAKVRLAIAAAELVENGDVVFLDGSTTTDYIGRHLTEKKDITVITPNVALVAFLSKYGINVICLGGSVTEAPYILGGNLTVQNAYKYNADKMFFATGSVTEDGVISASIYELIHRAMADNSKKVYYVADCEKINDDFNKNLFDFSAVDGVITDYKFSDEVKARYGKEKFIEIIHV